MPLHDVGYRPWKGRLREPGYAARVIAGTGIRLAWQSRWLRRAVLFAWTPAIVFAVALFAFEKAVEDGVLAGLQSGAARSSDGLGILGTFLGDTLGGGLPATTPQEVAVARRLVWSRMLLAFMRAPQAVLLAVVIGLVAPPLISRDARAKAWLVYFTRPLRGWEYVLGKAAVLMVIVALITMAPAVMLWFLGVIVSPSVWVAVVTWDLPLRIIAASVAVAVPAVLLALAFSALTAESRIAAFAWFATWVACWITHAALTGADRMAAAKPTAPATGGTTAATAFENPFDDEEIPAREPARRRRGPARFQWLSWAAGLDRSIDRWSWLSLYHAFGVVQAWIFGIERRPAAIIPPVISLSLVSLASFALLVRRVVAPTRA